LKIKRLAAAAVPVGAAVLGTTGLTATPASASPDVPAAAPIICTGYYICVEGVSPYCTSVNAWADNITFYGHFELSANDGKWVRNSSTRSWPHGGRHYTFHSVLSNTPLTIKAWKENKTTHKFTNVDELSFTTRYGC
jgi:hypothetical protein